MPKLNLSFVIFLIVSVAVGIFYFKNRMKDSAHKQGLPKERVVERVIENSLKNIPPAKPVLNEKTEKLNSEKVSNSHVTFPLAPVPDNDDVFATLNYRADFYDEYVIPKMNSLSSSACKIIYRPSVYDQRHIFQNPGYEKNFFVGDPEAALNDPEFRLSAEVC